MSSNIHATGGERASADAGGEPGLDAATFTRLYSLHRDTLVRFCSVRLYDQTRVEDVVQDVFEKAYAQRSRFEPGRDFWPWLASIAVRTCIDTHRRAMSARARNEQYARDAYQAPFDATSSTVFRRFDQQQLGARIAALPARQRAALGLFALDGWSYEDIAEHLGDSVSAVKALLCRARASLRATPWNGVAAAFGVGRAAWRRFQDRLARVQAWMWTGFDPLGSVAAGVANGGPLVVAVAVVAGLFVPATGGATGGTGVDSPFPAAAIATAGAPEPAQVVAGRSTGSTPGGAVRTGHRPLAADAERAAHDVARDLLPAAGGRGDGPESIDAESFAVSPRYEESPTIFVAGRIDESLSVPLLASHDGGASWQRRRATGLAPVAKLLLPPAYPTDNRLFAATVTGLQVSHDDGNTFETLATLPNVVDAAISPGFGGDDPSVLLVAAERLWAYDDDSGKLAPVVIGGTPATHRVISVAHAVDEPGHHVIVVGSRDLDPLVREGPSISRCVPGLMASGALTSGLDCHGVALPNQVGEFSLRLPSTMTVQSKVAYVPNSFRPLVSTDNGRSFRDLGDAARRGNVLHGMVDLAVVPSSGGSSAIAAQWNERAPLARTDDMGKTWAPIVVGLPRFTWATLVVATPTGRIVAAGFLGGIACSEDGGRTWARLCPTPEAA